jgi:hypothetical protein
VALRLLTRLLERKVGDGMFTPIQTYHALIFELRHRFVIMDGIASIGSWLARYRAYWPKRIEALSDLLKDMDQ